MSFFLALSGLVAADVDFTVTNVVGDVTFRAYKSFKKVPVKVGDKLGSKGKISLKDGDALDLETPMGDVLNFKDKTFATLSKLTQNGADKQVEISMPLGSISCDVKKLSKDSSFQVRTPSAVAGVRGTKFGVTITESGTATISVTEGLVAVQPSSGGSAVSVGAGQSASVKSGGGSISVKENKPGPAGPKPDGPGPEGPGPEGPGPEEPGPNFDFDTDPPGEVPSESPDSPDNPVINTINQIQTDIRI